MRQERRQKKQNALILNIIIDNKIKLKIKLDVDIKNKPHNVSLDILFFCFFRIGINGKIANNNINK